MDPEHTQRQIQKQVTEIDLSSLNVYGLKSKLEIGELYDHIKPYKIFCVSESKMKTGVDIEGFTAFNLENRTQNYPLPSIHGLHVTR